DAERLPILWLSLVFALMSAKKFGDYSRAKTLLAHFGSPEPEARAIEHADAAPSRKGARAVASGSRDPGPARPVGAARAVAPPQQRIDEACARLEQALAQSPQQVRDFLSTHPKRTIQELRATAKDFQQREQALRTLSAPEA